MLIIYYSTYLTFIPIMSTKLLLDSNLLMFREEFPGECSAWLWSQSGRLYVWGLRWWHESLYKNYDLWDRSLARKRTQFYGMHFVTQFNIFNIVKGEPNNLIICHLFAPWHLKNANFQKNIKITYLKSNVIFT